MKAGKIAEAAKWALTIIAAPAVLVQLYMVFFYAPTEKFMGHVQRIMYFHVPSAFVSFLAFGVVFGAGLMYLVTRDKRWDYLAVSSAEIGVVFTTLVLITGSLWARPVWNAWWVWDDPRLLTSLILWFLYVAYLMIRASVEGDERRRKFAAIFGIVGFIDVPIVYFSVTWWRTIHPKVITEKGANMPPEMTTTLLVSGMTFILLYFVLLWHRTGYELLKERVKRLREEFAEGGLGK